LHFQHFAVCIVMGSCSEIVSLSRSEHTLPYYKYQYL
jgi:hypothetical protein